MRRVTAARPISEARRRVAKTPATRIVAAKAAVASGLFAASLAAYFPIDAARAADLGVAGAAIAEGVACESPVVKSFESVWLGHFTGGFSHALGPGLPVVLDWRDETLCFPNRASCNGYMRVMRRDFHRPEGDFTCLPIR